MKFREMRRSGKEVFGKDIEGILERGEYGVISVIGDNGYPYGVPVNYVYLDKSIYFHCAGEGHKLDAIESDSRVSFTVVSETEIVQKKFTSKYRSVIVFGKADIISGDEKTSALKGLIYKYSPDFIDAGIDYVGKESGETTVVKISIEHMKGKSGY
jgi:nitroimidazol reductase NimA-like FMN-containing flavoprotein (pyridoxamine 5'-phosphate oxidase superfamily)